MARPIKPDSEKRTKKITIRFTETEFKFINKFGNNLSDVIRDVFMQKFNDKKIIINTDKDPKYINELNKIGVNLNQISKKYNSMGELSSLDIDKLNAVIDILNEKIQTILE
ncbi:hypothetical protein B0A67_24030 [Flavobacterium aquidurense]|uniref:plasmid mobilization protein n=1 Tax=Flavobacterium aquidurense TaxID=362413 RepID=UPI000921A715|nr:plasmid mobilization relaxosome protein MobC [Flavobacterium aquidurense]OXA65954.1 hypothetical protein B0A67_24030 [Flavobacterium aquidurense]SHH85105.1 mobilisation protein (MobC) [Flavobacterium frigidimaris]